MIWFGFRRFLWLAVFSVRAVGSPFVASGPCEDDRGGAERPLGEEGAGQVQRGRHHRRPQEAGGGADRDAPREDPEVVQHLQGPHHPQGLRDPRRHGPRALLQPAAAPSLLSGTY